MTPYRPFYIAIAPLGYLLIALLGAGLLAYPLYGVLHNWLSIRALVSRSTLLLILLSLPWLITKLRLGRQDLGAPARLVYWPQGVIGGLLMGVTVMALLVGMEMALGLRIGMWLPGRFIDSLLAVSSKPLLVGLLVGCVEELLFRGVLLGALMRYRGPFYAIVVSAFYYAALHFYHSDLKPPVDSLNWSSGLTIVWDGFIHLFQWKHLDSFVALFCAGLFLGCLRLLSAPGLALCIGVHAGWVYVLRVTLNLSDPPDISPWRFLIGDYDRIIGWLAAGWLALLSLPLLLLVRRSRSPA